MKTATKEKPIIFSAPMIQAILDGRKSMTRRVVKPQPNPVDLDLMEIVCNGKVHYRRPVGHPMLKAIMPPGYSVRSGLEGLLSRCPYTVGMRLWVRETARIIEVSDGMDWAGNVHDGAGSKTVRVRYEADGAESGWLPYPSRLEYVEVGKCVANGCYREASRLTLEVTAVRVERLQEISEADAQAEGVKASIMPARCIVLTTGGGMSEISQNFIGGVPKIGDEWLGRKVTHVQYEDSCQTSSAADNFERLWNSIHGPGAWDLNPFVWCISFCKIEGEK